MKIIPCLGFKRSGSTMQYNIVAAVLKSSGCRFRNLGFMKEHEVLQTDWDAYIEEDFVFFKCHDWGVTESVSSRHECLPLFIKRDIRDVYVSMKRKWNTPPENIPAIYKEYVAMQDYLRDRPQYLLQNYDDVYGNEALAASQVAKYLGIPFEEEAFEESFTAQPTKDFLTSCIRIIQRICSVRKRCKLRVTRPERYIQRKIYLPLFERSIDSETQLHPDHISDTQGRSGVWRELLTREEIKVFEELGIK